MTTQTPGRAVADGEYIDYTPATAKVAGDVVEIGNRAFPVPVDLAANEQGALPLFGVWDIPKATGALSAGDAVYWDNNGTPNTGDALSGAATATSSGNTWLGYMAKDAASGDTYAQVRLCDGPTANSLPSFPVEVVAAAGTNQGTGTAIGAATGLAWVTGADATKGVVLPAAVADKVLIVKNDDAANAVLKVYPASSDAINALSANAALSMAAKTSAIFVSKDGTTWATVPLLPS